MRCWVVVVAADESVVVSAGVSAGVTAVVTPRWCGHFCLLGRVGLPRRLVEGYLSRGLLPPFGAADAMRRMGCRQRGRPRVAARIHPISRFLATWPGPVVTPATPAPFAPFWHGSAHLVDAVHDSSVSGSPA